MKERAWTSQTIGIIMDPSAQLSHPSGPTDWDFGRAWERVEVLAGGRAEGIAVVRCETSPLRFACAWSLPNASLVAKAQSWGEKSVRASAKRMGGGIVGALFAQGVGG